MPKRTIILIIFALCVGRAPDLPINKYSWHVTKIPDLNQTIEALGQPMDIPEVFLIEDNPADVLLTRQALSTYPIPLRIRVAKDGEQALITLTTPDCKPNLIILDLNMPKVDGHTVLERFQSKSVPVVIFSSGSNEAEVKRALALGAREYVKKPIGFRPFVDAVSGIVDRWLSREGDTRLSSARSVTTV